MTALETDIQWFIARDGRQHGPLSDVEMRKLVELGHLRQADLVWRLGFPDWRPVSAVFPAASAPASSAPAPAPAPSPYTPAAASTQWQPVLEPAAAPRQERTGGRSAGAYAAAPAHDVQAAFPDDSRRAPQQGGADPAPPRKGARTLIAALGLLAVAGAGAWYGYQHKDSFSSFTAVAVREAPPAPEPPETPDAPKTTFETAAVPSDEGLAALDSTFQKRPAWIAIKQEFPEWYEVRLKEAVRLEKEGKPEADITRHLVESLVGLRRQHADQALAASTAKHKELASAFLANLKRLSEEGAESCYDFISKGETSDGVVAMMQNPAKSTQIEAQLVAIVAAIAEGRKSPVTHAPPIKSDYDMLAAELNRLGWTQADMQLFADSKALARAPRERVCKMVQDWFTAHLAITDAAIQERLLFETLRPVVAG